MRKMCFSTEAGSYLRLKDSCITQLKAQGPSRTCNESKEKEGRPLLREMPPTMRKMKPVSAMPRLTITKERRDDLGEQKPILRQRCVKSPAPSLPPTCTLHASSILGGG